MTSNYKRTFFIAKIKYKSLCLNTAKGSFTNYVDKIFFDHLPPYVDNFYGMKVDKKWTFLDLLPTYLVL